MLKKTKKWRKKEVKITREKMAKNKEEIKYFVNRKGLCYYRMEGNVPDEVDITLCEVWLIRFGEKTKYITKMEDSYSLKHKVERFYGKYITNGAFIQAGINLGYNIKIGSINAKFNLGMKKWKEYCKQKKRDAKWKI